MPSLVPHKPSVTITIDQPRQVRFNWQAICRFEEVYGMSFLQALVHGGGARLITHLVWAGLLHDEPKLTIAQVERRIQSFVNNDGDIAVLTNEFIAALQESGVLGRKKTPTATETDEDSEGNVVAVQPEPEE